MTQEFTSSLLQQMLLIIVPALAALIARYLNALYNRAYSSVQSDKRWMLDDLIATGVKAAEQLYGEGRGEEKKEYVLQLVEKFLEDETGLKIDTRGIVARIEAEVFNSFGNKNKESHISE